jgi:hypothetical protein
MLVPSGYFPVNSDHGLVLGIRKDGADWHIRLRASFKDQEAMVMIEKKVFVTVVQSFNFRC